MQDRRVSVLALFGSKDSRSDWSAHVSGLGRAVSIEIEGALDLGSCVPGGGLGHAAILRDMLGRIWGSAGTAPRAVGHRIVHGGLHNDGPARLDAERRSALLGLVRLAPGHQPQALACVDVVEELWPSLPQVGCFDTAFHRTQDRLSQIYPIPRDLTDEGLVRFGFHGLSFSHVARVLPGLLGGRAEGRIVVAHLGHGASLCAMRRRRSVATTMGFTTLDGLMMGSRSRAVDPGLVLYLIKERGLAPAAVSKLLNEGSGLLGVSGLSDDVRILEASGAPAAREALDLFAYRVARESGSLIAALGGIDALVFTGGIGENSAGIRAAVCERLAFAGLHLDPDRNRRSASTISPADAEVPVLVVASDEEAEIASSVEALLGRDAVFERDPGGVRASAITAALGMAGDLDSDRRLVGGAGIPAQAPRRIS